MKFTTSSDTLHDALQTVKRGVPSTTTMPILEDVLVETEGEDAITLRATDLEVHIQTRLKVQPDSGMGLPDSIQNATAATLPAGKMASTLKQLPDLPVEVTINTDGEVVLETDQGTYEMKGHRPDDYPDLPDIDRSNEVDAAHLKEAFQKVEFAVSDEALRPAMTGVYLDADNDAVVATDGHRLSRVETDIPLDQSIIITEQGVSLMRRVLETGATLCVDSSGGWAVLESGPTTVYSNLLDESYPNYESVIPDGNDKTMTINREKLEGATKRAGIYSSTQTNQVRFDIRPDRLTISAEDVERASEAEEVLFCDYDQETPLEIGFNANYVHEVLSNAQGKEVTFKFDTPNRAALAYPNEDDSHMMLIMPVMIS